MIELTFSLADEEHDSLADDYKVTAKRLRVRKYFQTAIKTPDGKSAVGSIFGYKSDGTLSTQPFYGADVRAASLATSCTYQRSAR